jgi:hypothetical protein
VLTRTDRPDRPAPAASQRRVPIPRVQHPITRGSLHEASTRVQAILPSGLPLACRRPDGTDRSLGFPLSFGPRRPRADDARQGGDRPSSTDPKQRSTTSAEPPIQRVYSWCATSRRTSESDRAELAPVELDRAIASSPKQSRAPSCPNSWIPLIGVIRQPEQSESPAPPAGVPAARRSRSSGARRPRGERDRQARRRRRVPPRRCERAHG